MARGRSQAVCLILLVALVAGAWAADPVPAAKPAAAAAAAAKPEVKAAGNAADAAALAAAEAAGMPGDAQKHVSIPANSNAVASTMQASSPGKSNSTAPVLTDRFWDCLCNKTSAEELKKTPTAKAWSCACSLKNKDQATAPKQQPAAAVPPAAKAPQEQQAAPTKPAQAQAPQQPQQAAPTKPAVPAAAAPKVPVAAPKTPEAPKEVVKQPEAPKAVEKPPQTKPAPAAGSKAEPALPAPAAVQPAPVAEPAPVQQPAAAPRTVVEQDSQYQDLRRRDRRFGTAVGGGARAFQRPGPGMPGGGMGLGRSMPSVRSGGGLPNRPFASATPPPMDTLRRGPGANSQPGLPVDDTINKLPFAPGPVAGGMPMPTSNMDRLHGNDLPHAPAGGVGGGNALNEPMPHGLDVALRPGFGGSRGGSSNNNLNRQQQPQQPQQQQKQAGNSGLPNMPAAVDQQQPLASRIPRGYSGGGRDSYNNRGPYGSNPRGPAYNREQYGKQYPNDKRYQESPRYGGGPDKYGRPEYPEPHGGRHEEEREHERYYEEPKYEQPKYEDDKYAPHHHEHEPKYDAHEPEPYERHHEEYSSEHEDSYEPRKRYYEDDEHDEGYHSHGEESEHEDEYEPRYHKGGSHKVLEEPEEEEQTLIIGGKKLVNKSKKSSSGVKDVEGEGDATAADGADFKRSFAPNIQEEDVPSPIPGATLQANKDGVLLVTELKMVEGFKGECNAKSVDWVQERASRLLVADLDSVGIKSKIKSALWTCALSRDGNVQESLYGRMVMRFVMQIEPVCDYRAYLRKFSCSTTRLIPELVKALSAVSDNDMCVFRLGQPDRQCKKMDTFSYIVTQRELPSLSELQNWAELDLAKAPTWDGVGFKPWSADVAPYDPSDPYGLKGGDRQQSSSSKKKTSKKASKPSEGEQKWDKVLESEHTEQADPPINKPELPTEPIHKPEVPPTTPPTLPPVEPLLPPPQLPAPTDPALPGKPGEDPPHPPETRPELPPQQPTPPPLKQQPDPIATPPTIPPVVTPPVDDPVDLPDDPRNPTDPRPPTTTPPTTQPPTTTPPIVPSDNSVAPNFGNKVKLVTSSMRRLLSNFDAREVM